VNEREIFVKPLRLFNMTHRITGRGSQDENIHPRIQVLQSFQSPLDRAKVVENVRAFPILEVFEPR
jgi:guanylate kinase